MNKWIEGMVLSSMSKTEPFWGSLGKCLLFSGFGEFNLTVPGFCYPTREKRLYINIIISEFCFVLCILYNIILLLVFLFSFIFHQGKKFFFVAVGKFQLEILENEGPISLCHRNLYFKEQVKIVKMSTIYLSLIYERFQFHLLDYILSIVVVAF